MDNLLIKGDNLPVLKKLKETYEGSIKLIYIDPPYNTKKKTHGYNDKWATHKMYGDWIKPRLEVAKELLSEDGSIWIQIDDYEHAYLKVLCDEIFGEENFKGNIVWERRSSSTPLSKEIVSATDYILVYSKNIKWKPNRLWREDKDISGYKFDDNDGKGKYASNPLTQSKNKDRYDYPVVNPKTGKKYFPTSGSGWQCSEETMKKRISENKIIWLDNNIRQKTYLSESGGMPVKSFWDLKYSGSNATGTLEIKSLFGDDSLFSTPKPEKLIRRIIHIGSNPGDLVLDFFAGSGTTAAVAHKMGRKWITVEQMDYIEDITKARLQKVIDGEQGGISKDIDWQGGGSFKYLDWSG